MYGLVNYQLSGIQKGIQFCHAVVEYGNEFYHDKAYKRWSMTDKTVIVLNGGTTNNNHEFLGTMNKYKDELKLNNINYAWFTEPDLGDQITALAFLVDERVYDNYMLTDEEFENMYNKEIDYKKLLFLRNFLSGKRLA